MPPDPSASARHDLAPSLIHRLFPPAPPTIERELIAQLIAGSGAIRLLGLITLAIGIQAALNADPVPAAMLFATALISAARVAMIARTRRAFEAGPPSLAHAQQFERRYALGSFASSVLLGGTNLVALSHRDPPLALLTVCALCCYVFSVVMRTAVRPMVCLPSVAIVMVLTLTGLPFFLGQGGQLSPVFAASALASVGMVLLLSCVQLSGHLYRMTLGELTARRDLVQTARQDHLTGLDNRVALRERFEALAPGPARPAALLYLDLDGFKGVNDTHGHKAGDALLCEVAARLNKCLRPGDGAFRIGGDEFVVLQTRVRQRSDAEAMARRLLASICEPYALAAATVRIGLSIGIALVNEPNADLDTLAETADSALYDAKRAGRGTFRFGDESPPALRSVA